MMKKAFIRAIAVMFVGLASTSVAATDEQALHFRETERTIELTVPAGGIWLVIPREGFVRLTPVNSGASGLWTFDLIDERRRIEIFGGFDSADRYPGIRGVWAAELRDLKVEEAPAPRNIRFSNDGPWSLITYEIARPSGITSYLRAEAVRSDVWIDLQIEVSAPEDASARLERALETLRGLSLREDVASR